jgi:hypothetical protein
MNKFNNNQSTNHNHQYQQQQRRNCCALFVGLHPHDVIEINNEYITYEEWRKRRIDRAQSQSVQQQKDTKKKLNKRQQQRGSLM